MKKKFLIVSLFLVVFTLLFGLTYYTVHFAKSQLPVVSIQSVDTNPIIQDTHEENLPNDNLGNVIIQTNNDSEIKVTTLNILPVQNDKKIIYLTIDDGPSSNITPKMLDVLKQYNIKATFFIIGNLIPGREDILKRIYNEGHSIGLHSYTHNIKLIYKNQDIFINEMLQTSDQINKILGIRPKLLRFPGGSSKHLNKQFLDRLHGYNFKVYDWSISAGDGMYPNNPPDKLFENATNPKQITKTAILLMHCKPNNQVSYETLPRIIEYYKNLGFEFKQLTDDSPEYYFRF